MRSALKPLAIWLIGLFGVRGLISGGGVHRPPTRALHRTFAPGRTAICYIATLVIVAARGSGLGVWQVSYGTLRVAPLRSSVFGQVT
jgi:hypothetical protein